MKRNLEMAISAVKTENSVDMLEFRAEQALGIATKNLLTAKVTVDSKKGIHLLGELVEAAEIVRPVFDTKQSPVELAVQSLQGLNNDEPPDEYGCRLATLTDQERIIIEEFTKLLSHSNARR